MIEILPLPQLPKSLKRTSFCSPSDTLNHYFYTQVSQDIKRRVTACFVAIEYEDEIATASIIGFYTLASTSVVVNDLPLDIQQKLPRYPSIPAVLLGRLAIDNHQLGKGLGGVLLIDALRRAKSAEIMAYALIVDAKDNNAKRFYQHFGFISTTSQPDKLFFPLANVK